MLMLVPCAPPVFAAEGADREQPRAGRDAEQALVRRDRARHAGTVRMRGLVVRGERVEVAAIYALQVGMLPSISESITATFTSLPVAIPCASGSRAC